MGRLGGGEGVADKEHEFREGKKLNGPEMADAIGILAGTQSEVEFQDGQVGDVLDLLVVG